MMPVSRRALLQTLLLAPLAKISGLMNASAVADTSGTHSSSSSPTGIHVAPQLSSVHGSHDPWIEIRPDHLRHNARRIHSAVEERPVLAVIKNDGYGMGLVPSARTLESVDGLSGFGVVKLNEAITLREQGIRKPILLMGAVDESELEEAVRLGITPMVHRSMMNGAAGASLERLAARLERRISVEVKLDTGLGRLGVRDDEALDFYSELAGGDGVRIQGAMITFSEDREHDAQQARRFESLMERVREQGIDPGRMHAASTTPLLRYPEFHYDMVRPGIGLYGVYPQAEQRKDDSLDLRPAFALRCRVADLRPLKKGESAGYGRAYVAERDTWLATLPLGHADGWQRDAAGCARVRINGEHYPVVGSVSASHTLVDVGKEGRVRIGDQVTIFDWESGSRPEEISEACDISNYDLLMHLSSRIPRYMKEENS